MIYTYSEGCAFSSHFLDQWLMSKVFLVVFSCMQGARHYLARARAALKYIVLALSGHMDDILAKYKVLHHSFPFSLS